MTEKLSHKQERFCVEYVTDYNATKAAIRSGYSKATAGQIGFENLKKPEIASRIEELQADLKAQCMVQEHVVLQKLMAIVDDPEAPGSTHVSALSLLGKHIGMWTEKVEHSGNVGPQAITRVMSYRDENGKLIRENSETGEIETNPDATTH